jgi:hypothetical protein
MAQTKQKVEKKEGTTLSHGNNQGINNGGKMMCSVVVAAAITLGAGVSSYRLKKTAEMRLWQKTFTDYSALLEKENLAAVKETLEDAGE